MNNVTLESNVLERNVLESKSERSYVLIPESELQDHRVGWGASYEDFPIVGCQKLYTISYFPSGRVTSRPQICDCDSCLNGYFQQCTVHGIVSGDLLSDDLISEDYLFEEEEGLLDSLRQNLVAVGSFVAVKSDERGSTPYWLYLVVELMEADFVGIYFESIQSDRLRLKKTKVKETIDFRCVFGPDVVVGQKTKGKANKYTLSPQMDMELCHFSVYWINSLALTSSDFLMLQISIYRAQFLFSLHLQFDI